ncbi:tyrosine-type recombinase/integrase [Bosea sp. BH3]|uniref:tyrosine-type recombinase/integrase n=1 Tax=Bosea sp. BH3 TaxID=2871701 RepID=UPI0021CB9699|nr:tyrosine-type recombinase/integrase [Bosea sp. BH3]MCU4179693.1 hypothetical protein [Bosea sp. BH3]
MDQISFNFERSEPALMEASPAQVRSPNLPRKEAQTLADVAELVQADRCLADTRRRDLLSGLNRFATIAGQPLVAIPATAAAVRHILEGTTPRQHNLKKKSFQTLRSTLAFAVKTYGPVEVRESHAVKRQWNAEWMELVELIDVPFRRHALSRFAAFCSSRRISPAAVTNSTLADFLAELLATEVVKLPKTIVHGTVSAWNRAGRDIAGWPQLRLTSPTTPVPHIFPLAAFSESFKAELASWQRRTSSAATSRSIFRDEGLLRELRPDTVKSQLSLFRQVASALVRSGAMQIKEIISLNSLCDPDKLRVALEFEHDRLQGNDRRVLEMANKIRVLCKHFDGVTDRQIAGLERLCLGRPERRKEITEQNRLRLAQFDEPGNYEKLLRFPERAAAQARQMTNPYRAAKRMEQAVAIAILLRVAPRLATLRQIELFWLKHQADGSVVLSIPPTALKARRALEVWLNADCGALIDELIHDFRPDLPCASGPYLFPGEDGGPRSKNAMYEQVTDVGRELGMDINPHLYRHLLQKMCVERDPRSVAEVSRVLGHASTSTTITFYADRNGNAASKRLDALLMGGEPEEGDNA